ncbi:MAG: ABC transporter permease [Polyangiales bacterium]
MTEYIERASFGIYMPKFWQARSTKSFPHRSSAFEVLIGYVGAAATKSVLLGVIILLTARVFVPYHIEHPTWMIAFLVLTALTFSLFGFIIRSGRTG